MLITKMPLTPPNVSASMIGVKNFAVKLLLRRSNNLILFLTTFYPLRTEMHDRELRNNFNYCLPNCRTKRHKNSFIPTMYMLFLILVNFPFLLYFNIAIHVM